jgi:hypothetical protein
MLTSGDAAHGFFDLNLSKRSRIAVFIAALLLVPTFFLPLWTMTLYSNQFPDGLHLDIYSYKLAGAKTPERDDLREINTLNHYIGMRPLLESDFAEFVWMPLVIGFFTIFALRTVVFAKMSYLIDNAVLFLYFGLFSFWSFYNRLYAYGHNLDPTAPVKVPSFTPTLFGSKQLANFTVYSLPGPASYFMVAFFVALVIAILLTRGPTRAMS